MLRISIALASSSLLLSLACVRAAEPNPESTAAPTVAPVEIQWAGAPSLEQVCDHVMGVMLHEPGLEPPSADQHRIALDRCVAELALEREHLGPDEYRRQAECLLAQTNLDAMAACEPPEADDARHLEICQHVVKLMKAELGDATQPSQEDIDQFLAQCVEELKRERERIGDEELNRQAACVLAATNMETLLRCDPDQ